MSSTTRFAYVLTAALAAFLAASCSTASNTTGRSDAGPGGDGGGSEGGGPASSTLGPDGGSVSTSNGTTVTVPPGALGSARTITITPSPSTSGPAGATVVGTPYVFGPEGLTFSSPVTVTLVYDPTLLPAGKSASDVTVFTAPLGSTTFTSLPTTPVDATHVSAPTTHFSVFVPAVADGDAAVPDGAVGEDASGDATSNEDAGVQDGGVSDGGVTTDTGGASDAGGAGGPVVLASGQYNPQAIAVDGTSVYFTVNATGAAGAGSVRSVPVDGGTVSTLATGQNGPYGVVVDGANAYWVATATLPGGKGYGTVLSVPLTGGTAPTTLVDTSTWTGNETDDYPTSLALQGSTLYFTTLGGAIGSVPSSGGAVTFLAVGLNLYEQSSQQIAVDSSGVYWVCAGLGAGCSYPVDGGTIGPNLLSAPLSGLPDGGTPATVVSTSWGANFAIAEDTTSLYWSDSAGFILSAPKTGGASTTLASNQDVGASQGPFLPSLAADASNVYWTDYDIGRVMSVPKAGGAATVLASGLTHPDGIAVYGGNLYWANSDGASGTVMKLPLK